MTFYFYDLETSGVNPREQRIMQFAGQRTNEKLEPIGDIDERLIKLSPDVLPEPWAILTHGITPQQANAEGLSEAEFLDWFSQDVATGGTIFVGYNTIRFDDEFMRYLHYRNFYDPYEWQWRDGRGKWDLLDVVRMTRALRPDGIEWPFTSDGKPTVALESMAKVNNLTQDQAHRADSDVTATLELAQLIREAQPKLFEYLLSMRDKKQVASLVTTGQPFVYTSGRYSSEYEKTTVVVSLGDHPEQAGSQLVYDLRFDPADFEKLSSSELSERIFVPRDSDLKRLPVKTMMLNRCPAVAPLGVLDDQAWERIGLDLKVVYTHLKKLQSTDLHLKVKEAFSMQHKSRQASFLADDAGVDAQLYDGFFNDSDKKLMNEVRSLDPEGLADYNPDFADTRLDALLPLYKARNFSKSLGSDELMKWESFIAHKINGSGKLEAFSKSFEQALQIHQDNNNKLHLLEELQLYVQSIIPEV